MDRICLCEYNLFTWMTFDYVDEIYLRGGHSVTWMTFVYVDDICLHV